LFFVALALVILAVPLAADAQQPAKVSRVGYLSLAPGPSYRTEALQQGLRDLGYAEGRNLTIEYRFTQGNLDRLRDAAAELVRLKMDVLVTGGPATTRVAKEATATISIVMASDADPVGDGFVASLARPGGNITGVFLNFPELSGKWLELLKEAVPRLTRVAVLWDPATGPAQAKAAEAAARSLRLRLQPLEARTPADFEVAFRAAAKERAGAMLALSSPVFNASRKQLADLCRKHRLPAILPFPGFAEDGGLMAYGPDLMSLFRQAGAIVAKILDGAKPADVPVEPPTRFQLAVNLKTAKALGLTLPQSILIRAEQMIQ